KELAENSIEKIKDYQISKYNYPFRENQDFKIDDKISSKILLLDQVRGDLSLIINGQSEENFKKMYDEALIKAKGEKIYIKLHPKGCGYLEKIVDANKVIIIDPKVNIMSVMKKMREVFTVSSQGGFEALFFGLKVHTFGISFYSGYGLTKDYIKQPQRMERGLAEVFYAMYVHHATYFLNNNIVSFEELLELIIENSQYFQKDHQSRYFIYKISIWKRLKFVNYINSRKIYFVHSLEELQKYNLSSNDKVVTWGYRREKQLNFLKEKYGVEAIRVEDGFIRSIGLGSNLVKPYSLALDSVGIYYNYHVPSTIEKMLNEYYCSASELKSAKNIVAKILENNVNKYGLDDDRSNGELEEYILKKSQGRKISLVIEQVANDLSVKLGSSEHLNTNEGLLRKVKENFPDDFIIYKRHPDVIGRNRESGISNSRIMKHADYLLGEQSNKIMLLSDKIHVLSSLFGFEALIRNKKVYTYGMPFYAGWGLTVDLIKNVNRKRSLGLEELVYIALFKYCRYYDWENDIFLCPNSIIKKFYSNKISTISNTVKNKFYITKFIIIKNYLSYIKNLLLD
ncbi:MAG: capsular polysaccharide export protein, partial [Myxococcota bacterium]